MFKQMQKARGRALRRATLCAAAGLMIVTFPDPTLAQQGSAAGSPSSSQPPSRITLPTVTVTAQKEPADPQELPVSVTTVLSGDDRGRGHHLSERRRHLLAEHVFHGVHRAKAEQRAIPWHRIEPQQPGDHDLHRRRAAAERQLVEPSSSSTSARSSSSAGRRARSSAAIRLAASSTSTAAGRR